MLARSIQHLLPVLLFLVLTSTASAEIYSWVDEYGKTHYGDSIPEKYQQQVETVTVTEANSYSHSSTDFRPDPITHRPYQESEEAKARAVKKEKKQEARTYGVSISDLKSIREYCAKKFPDDPDCVSSQASALRRNALKANNAPYRPRN